MRSLGRFLGLIAAAIGLLVAPARGDGAAPSPFAKGPLEKINLDTKQLVLKTKDGSCSFTFNARTYFYRGKQKISAEELHLGETLALRFATGPQGERLIVRLKAAPGPAPAAAAGGGPVAP